MKCNEGPLAAKDDYYFELVGVYISLNFSNIQVDLIHIYVEYSKEKCSSEDSLPMSSSISSAAYTLSRLRRAARVHILA